MGRKTNTVFVVILGCVLAAVLTSVYCLWMELVRYKFDIKAQDAKQRVSMVSRPLAWRSTMCPAWNKQCRTTNWRQTLLVPSSGTRWQDPCRIAEAARSARMRPCDNFHVFPAGRATTTHPYPDHPYGRRVRLAVRSRAAHYAKVCGRGSWDRREQIVESLWADIRKNLDALRLDGPKTKIYQDGLPICGFEERIVRELANAGSVNHQLIVGLLDRGAAVMGTEDPQLLMEEYELHKQSLSRRPGQGTVLAAGGTIENAPTACWASATGSSPIGSPLRSREGETGLLFLGALHRLDGLLPADVRLETLA